MSLYDLDNSEEALPFKVFEPRSSSRFQSSTSTSMLNLTVGSPVVSGSPQQFSSLLSPGGGEETEGSTRCFDFTGLLASSSPSGFSTLMNQDLLQMMPENTSTNPMMTGFSGDPNLPKRLHVSNLPFRYR